VTPDERKGIEELLDSDFVTNPTTLAWLKRQLEHNDWDNSVERMGGGRKARNAYMNPIFDVLCATTAFDMHVQLTGDGRERGLWVWLNDESKARAEVYDNWAKNVVETFCQRAGIDDKSMKKFSLSMAMDEFKNLSNSSVKEGGLLEWPAVKKMYDTIGKELKKHAKVQAPAQGRNRRTRARRPARANHHTG
jgi:hypothetical protein